MNRRRQQVQNSWTLCVLEELEGGSLQDQTDFITRTALPDPIGWAGTRLLLLLLPPAAPLVTGQQLHGAPCICI